MGRKKQEKSLKQKLMIFAAAGILVGAGIAVGKASWHSLPENRMGGTQVSADTAGQEGQAFATVGQIEERKEVALTFDDGPDPVYTPVLLEGLAKRDVKATFFLMGKQAEQYPEIVKQIYEGGHEIGNHTYSHIQLNMASEAEVREELDKTNEIIYDITGVYPEVFRPPFGSLKDELEDSIEMAEILWDIDPLDWCTADTGKVVERIVSQASDHKIILMHDASQSSVDAALSVIDILQERGYEFVTVEDIIYE